MDLSIIIVYYKTRELLLKQLNIIKDLNIKLNYEVVVVDNGSSDSIENYIFPEFEFIKFVQSKKNLGYFGGANIGLKTSSGQYKLILNSDIFPQKDAVELMFDFMEKNKKVSIVGPKLLYPDLKTQNSCFRFHKITTPIFRRTFFGKTKEGKREIDKMLMNDFNHDFSIEADWVLGAAIMIRSSFINSIGGSLDERYFLYYEDMDLCKTAWLKKTKVVYLHSAKMIHFHQRESAKYKNIFEAIKNRITLIHIRSAFKYFFKYLFR